MHFLTTTAVKMLTSEIISLQNVKVQRKIETAKSKTEHFSDDFSETF